jgi:predicted TIM-barrel fold metal-dependent hydrolase
VLYTGTIISSDDHVMEPGDLWVERMGKKYGDRTPRIAHEETTDWWVAGSQRIMPLSPGTLVGKRFEDPEKLSRLARASEVRPGAYLPGERIKDMDADGIATSILYGSVAIALYHLPDQAMLTDVLRTYNDWIAEYCHAAPKRLKGIGLLNAEDVPTAAAELERCARLGLAGGLITTHLQAGDTYADPRFEPLWDAAEHLGMPLGIHIGANRPGPEQQFSKNVISMSFLTTYDYWVRVSLADIIFSGVFDRHPKLLIGSIEHELAWIPHWLERMDYAYTQKLRMPGRYTFTRAKVPSAYYHSNCFASFQEDALGIRLRDVIGAQTMLWGSDYPHVESTFPKSREITSHILAECSTEEQAFILHRNAARVYHLE